MDECAICETAEPSFIMIEGGWYLCVGCITDGSWRNL
jgi:hypothetical protein